MSVWAEKWAYEQECPTSGAKFVLVCLAHHADEHGYCYPSQKRIAAMTGLKERAVRGHLARLEQDGVIRREERRRNDGTRTSDGIYLNMPEEALKLPAEIAASENATGKKRPYNRQKTTEQPANIAGPYIDEQSVNSQESSVVGETLPDDTTTTCLKLLLQVEGFPRGQGENAIKLAEYRQDFPGADAVEVCKDFKAYTEETGKAPTRLRLRNFFKQAAKNRSANGNRGPTEAVGAASNSAEAAARRQEGYEWLFGA